MAYRRKLIEVALPLEAISAASVYEKYIRLGHPNALHQWWSRKPLASARAVLFASLVDDPSEYLTDENAIQNERQRLFGILEQLIQWENSADEAILDKARLEIARSLARAQVVDLPIGMAAILKFLGEHAPTIIDPFAGGGSIPIEAQRLGLNVSASDLNPVAALINKAMIEIPPRFQGRAAVYSGDIVRQSKHKAQGDGIEGLLDDLTSYGHWIQSEAQRRIGWLYPPIQAATKDAKLATIVAWLWVRTVKCPNPVCGAMMPLASKWLLSQKKGRQTWVQPVVDHSLTPPQVQYTIVCEKGTIPERTVDRNGAICIACHTPVSLEYVRQEGQAGRLGDQMIAIAAEGEHGRLYLAPSPEQIALARQAPACWRPEQPTPTGMASNVATYGLTTFADLFTPRQLAALNTLADLIQEIHAKVRADAIQAGWRDDGISLDQGGKEALAYADAVATYLAFAFSKTLNRSNALVPWGVAVECPVNLFSRQHIPFIWDFAESNVIAGPSGSFASMLENTIKGLEKTALRHPGIGMAFQSDAVNAGKNLHVPLISTDPPYYDVIPYSDLADFFYVWLRRLLGGIYPNLFSTLLTPKTHELIADSHRSGSEAQARDYYEQGMRQVFAHFRRIGSSDYPLTVYYAYRQQEEKGTAREASTGWETFLMGIIEAGFVITGTWPIRTERATKLASLDSNVLASSIVLACRHRSANAPAFSRRDFVLALHRELAPALKELQQGNIAPVDLAQAAIGPGMAIFSRYSHVLETDGSPMSVRTALALINQVLDEYLTEQEGAFDADTRWALAWFEQYGFEPGPFGVAETLSKAKNTSVNGLEQAGILQARSGKVRLLSRSELPPLWEPIADKRPTTWEAAQYLIRALDKGGEQAAAQLLAQAGPLAETAHSLAYRLYVICERKKWGQEAMACNMLVVAWPRLRELVRGKQPRQGRLI
jgi:putative DNA methylase